ncbi:MAG: YafY family transcriptional regulator [Defluviitaleaceae bacterium]|nr:YafY family transcriptional regulator [Defluviitaleaceae bacterium]
MKYGEVMKTDRLLAIVIYLLNHDNVSAAKLAERFDVSKRTILRDIEHISSAGIPIQSLYGAKGGYSVMKGYKLDGRLLTSDDSASITAALKGLLSSYNNDRYNKTLEKIASILPTHQNQNIFLDFGASGENSGIQEKIKILENTINDKNVIKISYVNAIGEGSNRSIEPIALNYRWYAWYLLAFCTIKQDYRIFKLARITKIEITKKTFSKQHNEPSLLLEQAFGDVQESINITLSCKAEVKTQICEYLNGEITEIQENGDFTMHIHAIENERMWYAMLLSFGDKVKVLQPEALQTRLQETAKNILSLYKKW